MKNIHIAVLCALSLLCSQCKKDDGNSGSGSAKMYEIYETLNATELKFYENGEATGDYKEAIVLTGQWLETQPGVKAVSYEDSICIFIKMESGLMTDFCAYETDANGKTKYRGGGGGGTLISAMPAGNCTNKIENKKVLLFVAAYNDFYLSDEQSLQRVVDLFEDADSEFEVTVLKNEQCTPEVVATFGDYGFVSLETHGMPEGFITGVKLNIDDPTAIGSAADLSALINSKLGAQYAQWFDEGKLVLGEREYIDPLNPAWWQEGVAGNFLDYNYIISVSSLYLESLPDMPNTIINGNMCYSGYGTSKRSCRVDAELFYDNPIRPAFENLNVLSYYYYAFGTETSMKVYDDDAKDFLWELSKSFLDDGDSTGNAHLTNIGTFMEARTNPRTLQLCGPLFYKHLGHNDYCYGGCSDTLVDSRDGQVYKTVCIGNQRWMAENLNWAGAGDCYDNNNANCDTYGRLYSINELTGMTFSETKPSGVQGLCPQGWHVPSQAELQELMDFCGSAADAYDELRATTLWPTGEEGNDVHGFKMLPGGYGNIIASNPYFQNLGTYGYLATTSSNAANTPKALVFDFGGVGFLGFQVQATQDWKFSCRCIED